MFASSKKRDWQTSSAHLLLLSKFLNGDDLTRYYEVEYWDIALNEKPINVIKQFIEEGMLKPAGLQELMNYKFKVPDLKVLLKERALKLSGNKCELIQRLIDNDAKNMSEITKELNLYRCAEKGMKIAENYLNSEKIKREVAEHEALNLLMKKEYSKAAHAVAQYEATQVFPRGLGIDWKNYNNASDVEALTAIFDMTPAILKNISQDRLNQLRLAAGMMELWGTNNAQKWLPDNFETGIYLNSDAASRMMIFYAYHLRDMKNYKEAGIKTIKVMGVNDGNTCAECRKINNKVYSLENMPELPYAKCTCELGCRCCNRIVE